MGIQEGNLVEMGHPVLRQRRVRLAWQGSELFRQTLARLRSRRAVGRTLSPWVLTGCTGGGVEDGTAARSKARGGRRAFGRETGGDGLRLSRSQTCPSPYLKALRGQGGRLPHRHRFLGDTQVAAPLAFVRCRARARRVITRRTSAKPESIRTGDACPGQKGDPRGRSVLQ